AAARPVAGGAGAAEAPGGVEGAANDDECAGGVERDRQRRQGRSPRDRLPAVVGQTGLVDRGVEDDGGRDRGDEERGAGREPRDVPSGQQVELAEGEVTD